MFGKLESGLHMKLYRSQPYLFTHPHRPIKWAVKAVRAPGFLLIRLNLLEFRAGKPGKKLFTEGTTSASPQAKRLREVESIEECWLRML